MQTLLIVLVIVLLLGAYPLHGVAPHYGYGSGGLGLVLLIVVVVLLLRG
jgi:hypothetical protein